MALGVTKEIVSARNANEAAERAEKIQEDLKNKLNIAEAELKRTRQHSLPPGPRGENPSGRRAASPRRRWPVPHWVHGGYGGKPERVPGDLHSWTGAVT